MANVLRIGNRPRMVCEGLTDGMEIQPVSVRSQTFVYAGKLVKRFGVQRLLEAFALLKDERYRLIICGDGEMRSEVEAATQKDERICYRGVVPHRELAEVLHTAGVLVNPRTGDGVYTSYSFPSKVIEYLQTGLPVVSACLNGMPEVYRKLLYCPADDSVNALAQTMRIAMQADPVTEGRRIQAVRAHLYTLEPSCVAERLLHMIAEPAVQKKW